MTGVRQDGSSFPADITRSPLTHARGLLITTAIRDATDQVRAEDRIRRLNLELEKRVAERTPELRNPTKRCSSSPGPPATTFRNPFERFSPIRSGFPRP